MHSYVEKTMKNSTDGCMQRINPHHFNFQSYSTQLCERTSCTLMWNHSTLFFTVYAYNVASNNAIAVCKLLYMHEHIFIVEGSRVSVVKGDKIF
jgi:hypothetical protein